MSKNILIAMFMAVAGMFVPCSAEAVCLTEMEMIDNIEKVLTRAICNQNKITLTIDSLKTLPGLVVANDGKPTLVPSTLLYDEGNILGYVVLD